MNFTSRFSKLNITSLLQVIQIKNRSDEYIEPGDKIGARLSVQNFKYENKGGWPGLSILPKVKNLIDIGIGHQGTFGLYKFFPDSRYIFIDPLDETRLAVQSLLELGKEHHFVCTALGASDGQTSLNVRHPISQSGVYRYENEDLSNVEVRTVPVKSLDTVVAELNLKGSLGIKIDVEGFEMEVLKGASKALDLAHFVILELPIGSRVLSSYSFEDAIIFMKKFLPHHRSGMGQTTRCGISH